MVDDIKKINDEINNLRAELKRNPLKPFNEKDLEQAKALLSGLSAEVREMSSDLDYVAKSFKDSVNELSNQKSYLLDAKKSLNGIANIAQKITEYRRGETSLNEKQLKDLQKQAKFKFEELEKIKQVGNLSSENQREIIKTLDEQDIFNKSVERTVEIQKQVNKGIGLLGTGIGGVAKALSKMGFGDLSQPLDDAIEKTKNAQIQIALNKDEIEKINELQRIQNKNYDNLTDEEVERFSRLVDIYGIDKKAHKEKIKDFESQNQELSTQTSKYKNIGNALKDQLTKTNLIDFAIGQMVSALSKADNETGQLAKSFGTSYNEASNIRNELNTIANLSGDVNITTSALQKSLIAVNKEFGTATVFSGELLKDFTQLTEVAGYTNEAAARLSKISVATGTDLSKNTAKILGQAQAFNATNKLALNEKEIVEEVAKASKATTLSLGMQPGALTKAVAQAKALGSSLEKVESISQSLLNFESSISSELEAELLTGKNMNLERARMYALNNDIEGVAREIAGQIGSAADFTKMNVIQQEALAKAVGMTREDLASSLIERQALAAIGEGDKTAVEAYNRLKKEGLTDDQIAAKLGDKKLAKQLKSQSVQARFNASIEKLKETFISIAGPVLQIVSPIVDMLAPVLSVISGIVGTIASTFGKILGPLAAGYAILKSTQIVLTAISALQAFITTSKASELGLGGSILATLGFQNAAEMYKLTLMDGGNKKQAISAFLSKTILGSIIAQSGAILKNIGKSTIELGVKLGILSATLATNAALTFGVGVAVAIAAALAGYAVIKAITANDMVSSPGYGKRTLFGPEGAIQLNNKDTVIAGTDLEGNNKINTNKINRSSTSLSNAKIEALLSQMIQKQDKPVQVQTSVQVDGKEIAQAVGNNSTKLGNSMSTNTYKIQ